MGLLKMDSVAQKTYHLDKKKGSAFVVRSQF